MRFAYADPPYYGMGKSMYGYPEWDDKARHIALAEQLVAEFPDGWALSCNPRDLRWLLPECPDDTRVCAWVKPYARFRPTHPQYAWEPVLLHGGRRIVGYGPHNQMTRDWYSCGASQRKAIQGAKPYGFCAWVLDLLGYKVETDELVDLFPGSGIMGAVAAQGVLA